MTPAPNQLDAPFAAQPSGLTSYTEGGFHGWTGSPGNSGVYSAWLPGGDDGVRSALDTYSRGGGRFRLLFPERYHAPSREAHRLFTKRHLGLPAHLLVKIRVHPLLLRSPQRISASTWLDDPLLNRLPLAVWMQGPVAEARVVASIRADAACLVIVLRHRSPARLSILELTVSEGVTHAGKPALRERFEATGSDGFVCVNGVLAADRAAPRIVVHRGAAQIVQRDFSREPADIFKLAMKRANKDAARNCALTDAYLDACAIVRAIVAVRPAT